MTKLINDKLIHLGGIRLLAIIINPAVDIHVQVLFLFLLGIYLEVELLGHMITLYLIIQGATRLFFKMYILFYVPTNSV